MLSVRTCRAEDASSAINASLGQYKLQLRCINDRDDRRRRHSRMQVPRGSGQHQLVSTTVVHLISIIEAFVRDTLMARAEVEIDADHRMQAALWKKASPEADGGWDRQADAFKQWLGIPMKNEQSYKDVRAFVEARNAIVHGLGELTKKQLGQDDGVEVRRALASVGIAVNTRRLALPPTTPQRVARSSLTLVEWLDRSAWPNVP